jgi:hypothetical protein
MIVKETDIFRQNAELPVAGFDPNTASVTGGRPTAVAG